MQYRQYGKSGIKISALGFGAMRLPKDEDLAVECMRRYLDLGGNLIDTARCYGESERIVGQALAGRPDQVVLCTKNLSLTRLREPGYVFTPDLWQRDMETSFATLGVDRIDLYYIHDVKWDYYTEHFLKPGGPYEMVRRYLDEGSIGHLVFSCHETPEIMMKFIDEGIFDGLLLQYNLLDRSNEEGLAYAHEKGLGVNVMGPVGGGRLACPSERLTGLVAGVASVPEIALRFVLNNPNVSCVLSGMNSLEMVEENVAVASREEALTPEEQAQVLQALEENQQLLELYCTGCEYCLPCPQGVAIPEIFSALNYHQVWGLTTAAQRAYRRLSGEWAQKQGKHDASACLECAECESKCPQHLAIIELLREAHATLSEVKTDAV